MVLLSIHIDPVFSDFVLLSLVIIVIGLILRILNQPSIITYILVGVLMGPSVLGVFSDENLISNLGSLGLVLLLFFIGMEMSLPKLIANWKISVFGTLLQVFISTLIIAILGHYVNWKINQIILIGFVISLSSTAVIIKLLQERKEIDTRAGQNVVGILLAQDIIIVPMLIIMNYLVGEKPEKSEIIRQIIGGIFIIGVITYVIRKKEIPIPFKKYIRADHEIQVFIAFTLCFGFSILSSLFHLSAALGAFVAGIVLSSSQSTKWVYDSLHAFKVMFVALFFVSVGLLIDVNFLWNNIVTIAILIVAIFFTNNFINILILKSFGETWNNSIYAGALLSQIGELSFILGSTGYYLGIISDYIYQLVVSSIALTLFLSPFYIQFTQYVLKRTNCCPPQDEGFV